MPNIDQPKKTEIKLSVAIITYNHKQYIAQALESVLRQQVNFTYEIVIGDDCSTDGTREILLKYKEKYPDLIRLLLPSEKLGMNKNFITTIDSCRGQYIAYLEGDDYWLGEDKLQKQVDLLDKNESYKFCFHLVKKEFIDKDSGNYNSYDSILMPAGIYRRNLSLVDFLPHNFIGTCSIVFRNHIINKWPAWTEKIKIMDWPLYILLLEKGGQAGFINEIKGVYRIHKHGVLSGNPKTKNYYNAIRALKIFNEHFQYKYKKIINPSIYKFYCLIALEYYKENKIIFFLGVLGQILNLKIFYSPTVKLSQDPEWDFTNELINVKPQNLGLVFRYFLKLIALGRKFVFSLKVEGLFTSLSRVFKYIFGKKEVYKEYNDANFALWIKLNEQYDKKQVKKEIVSFAYKPKISIITPVYNVEPVWLDKCIQSVLGQYYGNWELCLYDDASTKKETRKCLQAWEGKDKRIKITYGKKNLHISGASNEALKLATGEYIALLDHDDELAPQALYEVVKLLNKYPQADFIYSDEDKIEESGERVSPFFKPDWNKNLFLSMMYTCHLGVYRKRIIDQIGGFRTGYEGSQDYDLVLRFIEKIDEKNIFHIPKILYHWRKLPTSTAQEAESKNYAYLSAQRALTDYLQRNFIEAEVEFGQFVGCYRIRRIISSNFKVSIIIIISNIKRLKQIRGLIENILFKTSYSNYEIIIIVNAEQEKIIQDLLFSLPEARGKIKVLPTLFFNQLKAKNYAAHHSRSDYLLFLNENVIDINYSWLYELVSQAQDNKAAIVGPKILYKNNYIHHAGIILGENIKDFPFRFWPNARKGYFAFTHVVRNYSAVSDDCLLIKKFIFTKLGGFNPELNFYSDVDLCLKAINQDYDVVYTSHAQVIINRRIKQTEKKRLLSKEKEFAYMKKKWDQYFDNDPYYNINLSPKKRKYFTIRTDKISDN